MIEILSWGLSALILLVLAMGIWLAFAEPEDDVAQVEPTFFDWNADEDLPWAA